MTDTLFSRRTRADWRLGSFFVALSMMAVAAAWPALGRAANPLSAITLHAVGADSMASLMRCWTDVYRDRFPGASVSFEPGLSAAGAEAMIRGKADIAPYAREFFPNEVSAIERAFGTSAPLIAVASGAFAERGKTHAIAVYVNASNPVESLTWSQLQRIFAGGSALTWGELGLEGTWQVAPVNVYGMLNLRDTGNPPGIVNFMRHSINGGGALDDSIEQLAGDEKVHSLQQIVDAVAADKHGIGYSGFGFGIDLVRSVPLVIDGAAVAGSPDSLRNRDYLLTRTIYIAISPKLEQARRAAVADFLRLVLGPAGQQCIDNDPAGFLPLPDDMLARQRARVDFLASWKSGHTQRSYVAEDGRVRVVGYNDMDQMLKELGAHLRQSRPRASFEFDLRGTRTAPPALAEGRSAFAPMGAEFSDVQLQVYREKTGNDPVPVRVAHASLSPKALSGPLAFFVNADNPLASISLPDARRIFAPTSLADKIEDWGQLGLEGKWADKKIQPCGLAAHTALATYLRRHALDNRKFSATVEGFRQSADAVQFARQNREALCFAAYIRRSDDVKALAVATTSEGPPIAINRDNIIRGRYPLDRFLYIYLRERLNEDADPLLYEYMQLVLSPAGQAIVSSGEREYLPLAPADLVAERLKAFGPGALLY